MERREDFIKRIEEQQRAEAPKAAPTDKRTAEQARYEAWKDEQDKKAAKQHAEAREAGIKKALETLEPTEAEAARYEEVIKQAEVLMEKLKRDTAAREELKKTIKILNISYEKVTKDLKWIYETLHNAGKLETGNKKKRGAFKNGI